MKVFLFLNEVFLFFNHSIPYWAYPEVSRMKGAYSAKLDWMDSYINSL